VKSFYEKFISICFCERIPHDNDDNEENAAVEVAYVIEPATCQLLLQTLYTIKKDFLDTSNYSNNSENINNSER